MLTIDKIKVTYRKIRTFLFLIDEDLYVMI